MARGGARENAGRKSTMTRVMLVLDEGSLGLVEKNRGGSTKAAFLRQAILSMLGALEAKQPPPVPERTGAGVNTPLKAPDDLLGAAQRHVDSGRYSSLSEFVRAAVHLAARAAA